MQVTTTLALWTLAVSSAVANIQIEYFPDSTSCRDDNTAEILHYQRESGGNCIKRSPDNNTFKIHSTNEDEPLNKCLGFYKDSACTQPLQPSLEMIPFKCDRCASTGSESYMWIE